MNTKTLFGIGFAVDVPVFWEKDGSKVALSVFKTHAAARINASHHTPRSHWGTIGVEAVKRDGLSYVVYEYDEESAADNLRDEASGESTHRPLHPLFQPYESEY